MTSRRAPGCTRCRVYGVVSTDHRADVCELEDWRSRQGETEPQRLARVRALTAELARRKAAQVQERDHSQVPAPAPAPAWAEVAKASQEANDGPAKAIIEAGDDFANDFVRIRAEARDTFGPGRLGLLKWVDARGQMMRPAVHALDPMWIDAFAEYYDSGKLIMLARKGLRAGGSSSACPALVRCALFTKCTYDAGTIGVIPIMSATRDEADGRFVTIKAVLRACGLTPEKAKDEDDAIPYLVPPGGIDGTFRTKTSTSGGGIIIVRDADGHEIHFKILPALVRHGVGYTGRAGFSDESDLWPNDPEHHVNPAEKIFDRISERFTTTFPGAEFLIFSASYNADSAHKRLIEEVLKGGGAADLIHLVRLGTEGARRDQESRRRLAAVLGSDDPRLLAPGDPLSPDLPAWVYNPTETIEKCHLFSKGDTSRMLGLYGGRAAENARSRGPLSNVDPQPAESVTPADAAIGVAPPGAGSDEWGIVVVGLCGGGLSVLADASATCDGRAAAATIRGLTARVPFPLALAVPRALEGLVRAELDAAYAGGVDTQAAVAPVAIHDGDVLRAGQLRTLYQRQILRHAPELDGLVHALGTWLQDVRSPRVEALAAAVTRLLGCYPHLAAALDAEPLRSPTPRQSLTVGRSAGVQFRATDTTGRRTA